MIQSEGSAHDVAAKSRVAVAAATKVAVPAPVPWLPVVGGAAFFLSRITVNCCASQHDLSHGLGLSAGTKEGRKGERSS